MNAYVAARRRARDASPVRHARGPSVRDPARRRISRGAGRGKATKTSRRMLSSLRGPIRHARRGVLRHARDAARSTLRPRLSFRTSPRCVSQPYPARESRHCQTFLRMAVERGPARRSAAGAFPCKRRGVRGRPARHGVCAPRSSDTRCSTEFRNHASRGSLVVRLALCAPQPVLLLALASVRGQLRARLSLARRSSALGSAPVLSR